MQEFSFDAPVDERVRISIGGIKYELPATLDVTEYATIFRLSSASKRLEDEEDNPDALDNLANMLELFKNLFRVYNSERKVDKLRLTQDLAKEVFNKVYSKNE